MQEEILILCILIVFSSIIDYFFYKKRIKKLNAKITSLEIEKKILFSLETEARQELYKANIKNKNQ